MTAPGAPSSARPPAHTPDAAGGPVAVPNRPGTNATLLALAGCLAALVVVSFLYLGGRIQRLEDQIAVLPDVQPVVPVQVPPSTVAPPIDLPPPDAETARRAIVGIFALLFGESTPEQRQFLLTTPSDLPNRLQALAGGPCAGTRPVVTDIRFLDDDRAEVRFRFEGATLPQIASGYSFDGFAARVDGRWLIDPAAPLQALDLGDSAGVCGS